MENENELLTRKVFLEGVADLKAATRQEIHQEVERLALITQKGFDGVAKDVAALDQRVTALEIRFKG